MYGTGSYGTGAFGFGLDFPILIPNPPGLGYGGTSYGYGSYGSSSEIPLPNYPINGGYGGISYGQGNYGGLGDLTSPRVVGAFSIDGFTIEIFFSEPMMEDGDLLNPANYAFTPVFGAAPITLTENVIVGLRSNYGVTSVIITHTGTTLGGSYEITVEKAKDLGGAQIEWEGQNKIILICKGEPPSFQVVPISGTEIILDFEQDILPEVDFTPGVAQVSAYETRSEYPVPLQIQSVTHPVGLDFSQVQLEVLGMTSAIYNMVVGPSLAFEYPALNLPTQTSGFAALEKGFGTSSIIAEGLSLSSNPANSYGWDFIDTSGRILPNSSFRFDFDFDLTSVSLPLLNNGVILSLIISDGFVQTQIDLERNAGIETLRIVSGGLNQIVLQTFINKQFRVSFVRNQKAGTYSLLWDDHPLMTNLVASFTGVSSISPGTRILINTSGTIQVSNLVLRNLRSTFSQTVFSGAWNFFHEQDQEFLGLAGQTKDFILTNKGPLVKSWGNATPATKQDVVVRINGVEVEVSDVNPYIGKIYPTIPIPLVPPGTMTVDIDYYWMYNPVFVFAELNTEGLILNKYDALPSLPLYNDIEGYTPVLGGPNSGPNERFPYNVVLNEVGERYPYQLSSRFWAFQKAYTAALNSPNTLLLNQNPHIIAKPSDQELTEGLTVFYEGTEDPTLSGWELVGVQGFLSGGESGEETGFDNALPGTYSVLDLVSGSFGEGQPSFYVKNEIVPFSSSIIMVSRFVVTEDVGIIPNGVFTGVGFGFHDDNHLYLVGALEINGLKHIGMLVEPAFPEKFESWKLAFESSIEILNSTTFSTNSLPKLIQERIISEDIVQFQILEGPQQGVYVVSEIESSGDGSFTCVVSPPFPENPLLYGNSEAQIFFEIRWDGDGDRQRPLTYRLVIKSDIKKLPKGYAELYVGGSLSGKALVLEGVPRFAIPPEGVLLFPTGKGAQFFWGSLSLPATNSSDWSFVRYGVQPGEAAVNFDGITVLADMLDLPENDPNNIWFVSQDFGNRFIDIQNRLTLQKTASSSQEGVEGLDLTLGYSRIEPFFDRFISCDVDLHFQVDTGSQGAGDALVILDDGLREIILSTITYRETLTSRELISLPKISLSGLLNPMDQGWVSTGEASVHIEGRRIQIECENTKSIVFSRNEFSTVPSSVGRVFEVTFQAEFGSVNFGFGAGTLGSQRGIGARLIPGAIEFYSIASLASVSQFPLNWEDLLPHTLRVIADPTQDVISVIIDDVVQGTLLWSSFAFDTDRAIQFGAMDAAKFEIHGISITPLPEAGTLRTLGVFVGPTWEDINSWVLPRTDGTTVKNSNLLAQIEPMDWTAWTKVRIHRDPVWGVVIQRPDLPLPPYYTGEFSTQELVPTSGWISVEYPKLPISRNLGSLGRFSFGALDPESITQQRWGLVKYRIFLYPGKDRLAPQHNVLNQYHVITSGEPLLDQGIETVTVISIDSRTIRVSDSGIFADRVFNFTYVNEAGKTVLFEPPSFVFDKTTQIITIVSTTSLAYRPSQDVDDLQDEGVTNPSLNQQDFPFPDIAQIFDPDGIDPNLHSPPLLPDPVHVPVTISFAAGVPFTKEYLCSQPFDVSATLLNEGTPDFTKNLVCQDTAFVDFNSKLNDPFDVINGNLELNDALLFVNFTEDFKCQYELIDFCETSKGEQGYLSVFCDNNVPFGYPGIDGSQPGDIGNGVQMGFSGFGFMELEGFGFSDGPQFGNVLSFLKAGDGNLGEAIIFTPLVDGIPPIDEGWSVVMQLYDVVTNELTFVYFLQE